MKEIYKKDSNGYILKNDDNNTEREDVEKHWMYHRKPIPYAELIKDHCFVSVGKCRGCINFKCAINGGTK